MISRHTRGLRCREPASFAEHKLQRQPCDLLQLRTGQQAGVARGKSWTHTYSNGGYYTYTRGTDEITFWSVNRQKVATYAGDLRSRVLLRDSDSFMAPQGISAES